MQYIRSLDGFRGWAVFGVMLFHFGLLDAGWIGVEFFFVLSGFLITSILLKRREVEFSRYLGRFWWRRILRIFPLYFAFVGICWLGWILVGHPSDTGRDLPYLLTYTINFRGLFDVGQPAQFFNYLWSLAVEEQFYLVWPFLVFWASPEKLRRIVPVFFLAGPLVRWLFEYWWLEQTGSMLGVGGAVYQLPFTQMDAFAMGAWVALAPRPLASKTLNWILGSAALLFLGAGMINWWLLRDGPLAGQFLDLGYPCGSWRNGQHIWSYTLIHLLSGAVLMKAVWDRKGWLSRALQRRFWVETGRISYGMYIIHLPLHWGMNFMGWIPESAWFRLALFPIYFVLSFGLAYVSHRWLEMPFLRLKGRFFSGHSIEEQRSAPGSGA